MRCLGMTKGGGRCRNDGAVIYCHAHRYQFIPALIALVGFIGALGGIYQDIWRGIFAPPVEEEPVSVSWGTAPAWQQGARVEPEPPEPTFETLPGYSREDFALHIDGTDYPMFSVRVVQRKPVPDGFVMVGETSEGAALSLGHIGGETFDDDLGLSLRFVRKTGYHSDVIGPFHYPDFGARLRVKYLAARLRQIGDGLLDCTARGCELDARHLCRSYTGDVVIRDRAYPGRAITVPVGPCGTNGRFDTRCFGVPRDIFPIRDDSELEVVVILPDGSGVASEPVAPAPHYSRGHTVRGLPGASLWAALPPLGDNAAEAPSLSARLLDGTGLAAHLKIHVGVGGCDPADMLDAIYIDPDGRGWEELAVTRSPAYSIRLVPDSQRLRLLLRLKDGKEYGPFSYEFPWRELVEKPARHTQRPAIECRRRPVRATGTTRMICAPRDDGPALAWLDVGRVRTGCDAALDGREIRLSVTYRDVIDAYVDNTLQRMSRALFAVPVDEACEDFFYQIVYEDGSEEMALRIPLK